MEAQPSQKSTGAVVEAQPQTTPPPPPVPPKPAVSALLDQITDEGVRREADQVRLLTAKGMQYFNSKAYGDLENAGAAVVKMEIGRALGIADVVALQNIYVIYGSVMFKYTLTLALMKRAGYEVKILQRDEKAAKVQILKDGKVIDDHAQGIVTFTMEDAITAGLVEKSKKKGDETSKSMYEKWARRMLFSKVISESSSVYTPEVTLGFVTIDPAELQEIREADLDAAEATTTQADALRERLAGAKVAA